MNIHPILNTYNEEYGTVEELLEAREQRINWAKQKGKAAIVTFPDGTEKEFFTCHHADMALKASPGTVARLAKRNYPGVSGKLKGFSARFA